MVRPRSAKASVFIILRLIQHFSIFSIISGYPWERRTSDQSVSGLEKCETWLQNASGGGTQNTSTELESPSNDPYQFHDEESDAPGNFFPAVPWTKIKLFQVDSNNYHVRSMHHCLHLSCGRMVLARLDFSSGE